VILAEGNVNYNIIIDTIGIIASVTSVAGFLPQIYKNQKTRSVQDLSGLMLVNFAICSLAWMVYGGLTDSMYVLVTNVAGLGASCLLVSQKLYFQK
jgi:MtN3 and saliva related transmembrane protein